MFHNSPYCFHVSCSAKDFEGSSAPCVDCVQPIGRRTPVSTISTPTPCYSHWAVPSMTGCRRLVRPAEFHAYLPVFLVAVLFCTLHIVAYRCISLHLMWQQLALQNWTKIDRCSNVPFTSHWTKERKHSSAPSTLGNVRSLERFASSMFKARKRVCLKTGYAHVYPKMGNFNEKNMGKWW